MLGSQSLAANEAGKHEASDAKTLSQTYPISDRYLVRLFSWIGIWAVLLIGFIWVVDPYGVSPFKIKLNGLNFYKPQRLDIDRLIKPLEVWRYQPKTIFIGTSRIQQSLDPAVFDGTAFAPAYNAAIPASTLMANADNIELFLKLDPQIKHIFLELFLYNFTQLLLDSQPYTYKQVLSNTASLEVSTDAFRDALKTLYSNRLIEQGKEPLPAFIADRGYRIPKGDFNPADTFNDIIFMRTVLSWDRSAHLKLEEEAFKPLERIIALTRQHGVQLHLIITPNYPWDDYRLMTLGYWPLLEKWLRKLAAYPNVVSFSQYNKLLQETPTHEPKMQWWNDPTHFSLSMGRNILKTYLARDVQEIPKNFRRDLNSKTVEAIIAERRTGLLQWAAQHPDFVMEFEDSKQAPDSVSGNLDLENKILIINGEKHPLTLGEGEVAFTQDNDHSIIASGWVVDEMAKSQARLLIATIGNTVVSQGYASVKRPDLALGFSNSELTSGFSIEIPLAAGSPSVPIRIFALMHDGRAVQLVSEAKKIDSQLAASPLGLVKAHELLIGKRTYPIADFFAGSVDKIALTPSGQSYRIDGWAMDSRTKTPVLALIAARGSETIAKSVPTLMREDLQQQKLLKTRPIGFSMLAPQDAKLAQAQENIRIFALLADGHVAPLSRS